MLQGFAPIADEKARVLILGTMPSERSLQKQQYYGHPQNTFWRILFSLWDQQAPEDYELRKAFLLKKNIALWDVLMYCDRRGSADTKIQEPVPNNFIELKQRCPHIQALFFNSQNAEHFYKRLIKQDAFSSLQKATLPSTSPARAMTFEKKRALWLPLRKTVDSLNPFAAGDKE